MKRRYIVGIMLGLLSALTISSVAYAASKTNVRIKVTTNAALGELTEPDIVSLETGKYNVTDVSWSKSLDKWSPGDKVTCTVYLTAEDGFTFDSSNSVQEYVTSSCYDIDGSTYSNGAKCDYTSYSKVASETAKISFRYYPILQLDATSEAAWSDSTKVKAHWKKVDYASTYQIKLYDETDSLKSTVETSQTTYDFSSVLATNTMYYYTVRAIGNSTSERTYLIDGEWVNSEETVLADDSEVGGTFKKSTSGLRYKSEDGNYVINDWRKIEGNWYYFNDDSYAVTGWVNSTDGKWYYMDTDGTMKTGWVKDISANWYYFDLSGAMQTGWYQDMPGQWYYSYPNGVMAKSTDINGYYVNENGLYTQ